MANDNYNPIKLKKQDIVEMVTMYESGNYTQEELGKKFGISVPTVIKILKANKAQKGISGAEIVERVKQKIDSEYNQEKEKYAKDVKTSKNESLLWARMVGMAIGKEVQKLITNDSPKIVEEISARIKALKDASVGLNNVMIQRWRSLNIDENQEEDSIPNLVIEDLTEEKLKEIHKRTRFQNNVELEEQQEEEFDLEKLKMELEKENV
jgi:DNA-binding transcriptional regulator LsrR (DeoR family)